MDFVVNITSWLLALKAPFRSIPCPPPCHPGQLHPPEPLLVRSSWVQSPVGWSLYAQWNPGKTSAGTSPTFPWLGSSETTGESWPLWEARELQGCADAAIWQSGEIPTITLVSPVPLSLSTTSGSPPGYPPCPSAGTPLQDPLTERVQVPLPPPGPSMKSCFLLCLASDTQWRYFEIWTCCCMWQVAHSFPSLINKHPL